MKSHRIRSVFYLVAVVLMILTCIPALPAVAQDEPAGSRGGPTAAPGSSGAAQPLSAAELAELPDRAQHKILESKVEGDSIHQSAQFTAQATYIASGYPDRNLNGEPTMSIGWDSFSGYGAMRLVMKVDLGSLPSNAQINNATFYIYETQWTPNPDNPMGATIYFMQTSWNPNTVTWNNANYLGGAVEGTASIPAQGGFLTLNVTDVVRKWVKGEVPNNGVLVIGDETQTSAGRWRKFYTNVGAPPNLAPYVVVDYTTQCDTEGPITTMNPLQPQSAAQFTVSWSAYDVAPPGCTPSGVKNFRVEYRINGGDWQDWGGSTEYNSTSLVFNEPVANGAAVEFKVKARDNAGNTGSYSAPTATQVVNQPPSATVNPLPAYTIDDNFTVAWTLTQPGMAPVSCYNVQFQIDGGKWQTLVNCTGATSYPVTGGSEAQRWGFRVQAVDTVGNKQPWSTTAQAETILVPYPVAVIDGFDPTDINPTSVVTDSFTVKWTGYTPPGTTITEFTLYFRYKSFAGSGPGWQVWKPFAGTINSAAFGAPEKVLQEGFYEFYATAKNNRGQVSQCIPTAGCEPPAIQVESMIVDPAGELSWIQLPVVFNASD